MSDKYKNSDKKSNNLNFMNMSVSNRSVIHYTSEYKTLCSILKDRAFLPSFCNETIKIDNNNIQRFAVAQVSFCDIPFSQIKQHVDSYGSYAIGLSKNWANLKHLNPVQYVGMDTPVTTALKFMTDYLFMQNDNTKFDFSSTYILESLKKQLSFMKHHTDDLYREKETIQNYVFYNEREWRYVPDNFEEYIKFIKPQWDINQFRQYKNEWNKELRNKNINLEFDFKDITYIILKNNIECRNFFLFCQEEFSHDELLELVTKIVTIESIQNDF